jgi:hypothetical protein
MPADEGADERTDRNNEKAAGLYVVEGSLDQARADTLPLRRRRHVRMDEHDRARLSAIADLADQLAVDETFVTKLDRVIANFEVAHGRSFDGLGVPSFRVDLSRITEVAG